MSFTGTLVTQQISPHLVRLTGLNLAANTAGTIGLHEATGTSPDVRLPAAFRTPDVSFQGAPVPLQASVRVDVEPTSTGPFTNLPPSVTKTGTTREDFRITITNTKVDATTQDLEIYVESRPEKSKSGSLVNVSPVITIVNGADDSEAE